MANSYYVYVLFGVDGAPCYVGKGKGRRWLGHERTKEHPNRRLRAIIAAAGGHLPKVKIRQELTEAEAFEVERAIIAAIGRGKNGPLVNLTDGGDGTSGHRHTPEARELIGAPRRGKARPDEVKRKLSAAKIGIPMGPQSETHRQKIADRVRAFHASLTAEQKALRSSKISAATKAAMGIEARGKISASRRFASASV